MPRMIACWTVVALLAVPAIAQEPKPKFAVASVKPFRERPTLLQAVTDSWGRQGGLLKVAGVTVEGLIQYAYEIERYQVGGGPDWVRTDTFAIDARPGAETSVGEMRRMLQSLLEDRFKLVTHEEQRDMKFYVLVRARADGRLGPYIRQFGDNCTNEMSAEAAKTFPSRAEDGASNGAFLRGNCTNGFSQMAHSLNLMFKELPVREETGLSGKFTYDVRWTSSGIGIVDAKNALEEQLGLTLVVKRGPITVRVIDSVSQPSEN